MMTALYSVVKYVDDVERGETVNVGALLWSDGQTYRKFVERESVPNQDTIRRFDELLAYIVEHDDRGDTEPSSSEEPLLFSLSRRRFPHFEITAPRPVEVREEPPVTLDSLVSELVDEPSRSHSLAFWR
jgi:hypothetical protein